jgi:hypothetical protein
MTETWTLEEQRAHRKLWVEALRSGKFEQCKLTLTDREGYCCLGVACIVAGKTDDDIIYDNNLGNFQDVRDFFGLRHHDGDYEGGSLVHLNDEEGYDFNRIAAVIESEPHGLFRQAAESQP